MDIVTQQEETEIQAVLGSMEKRLDDGDDPRQVIFAPHRGWVDLDYCCEECDGPFNADIVKSAISRAKQRCKAGRTRFDF